MNIDTIIDLGQRAVIVTLMASAPMLIAGMVVGLLISVLQSVTQIQEITLTFVPKIVVVMLMFILFLPWMADVVIVFVRELLMGLDEMVRIS